MATPEVTARARAITLITRMLDRLVVDMQVRHVEIAEVVDALIEAARAPESAHTRAVEDETHARRARREEV